MKNTEMKIYEAIGVMQFRKLAFAAKAFYNKVTKTNDNKNYKLKGYSKENVVFLQEQFVKNMKIHIFGTIVGTALVLLVCTDETFYLYRFVLAMIILLLNLYATLLQRYNLIRIKYVLDKRK